MQSKATAPAKSVKCTVLRAIYMHGERVNVGADLEVTPMQYAELSNAGKVGPLVEKPAKVSKKEMRNESV